MLAKFVTPSSAWSSRKNPREMPRRSLSSSSGAYSGLTPH
jgi:hypothetical protein